VQEAIKPRGVAVVMEATYVVVGLRCPHLRPVSNPRTTFI
jgi:GTP cyclohydrolase I